MLKGSARVGSISICKQRKTVITNAVNKLFHTNYNGHISQEKALNEVAEKMS
jgi:hypothetical protein